MRLALLVSSLAMTDRDRQPRGGGHSSYGEAVGVVLWSALAATPRLAGFAEDRLRLFGQVLWLAYGYSDATIW
jgi:hypothetical protein